MNDSEARLVGFLQPGKEERSSRAELKDPVDRLDFAPGPEGDAHFAAYQAHITERSQSHNEKGG